MRDLSHAAETIRSARQVALACHVSPDGDALGSMLALHHALLGAGIDSVASFPEPFEVAPHYRELPGLDLLTSPAAFPAEPDVMVTFDCGSLARLGELAVPAKTARELVVLDHHRSNDCFGTLNVVEPDAAATAVLVYDLIHELGLPMTREAAVCLYAGIVCDTGRFQYDSTSEEVFSIARDLLRYEVPLARLNRSLFEEHRFDYLQMVGQLLGKARLVPERRFVWVAVTQDDLRHHGVTLDETEGLIDIIRRTSEAEVACVLKEEADGAFRVSLRSLGDVDVCHIAQDHGGGGHRFAAGFTSRQSLPDLVARIEGALPLANGATPAA
ncbi:MAG TPA: bifunctional oligoribonuclease/PAP phosphatase NrnA [Acidimicrobiia bacterium]|nr:bifunctional oligoribonuclease/PAP phosphatase NrnA [Acidimicrobiia bacterium]